MGRRSGKTAKCIRMLQYLSSGRTVHIDEIAKFLDNTCEDKNEPRNVVEYRKELERAGYKLFIYNESWFTIGYCELAQDFRVFKLARIKNCHPTSDKFRISLLYNEKDHFDEFGFKGAGSGPHATDHNEWIHIKLKLTGRPAMWIKDSVYGKNQILTETEDGATILECDMHYRSNTIRFTLGFGENCEVLEPAWLKEELVRQAERILKIEKTHA